MTRPPLAVFKTSVRVMGADQVDEFRALCVLLGRRPHQLAADFVLDGIRRYREDRETATAVRALVDSARAYRGDEEPDTASNVISLERRRRR